MRVLILGAGAMGGYYGGRLIEAKAGADVTFLVREGRKKVLAERGLVIESASCGDLTVPVRAITAADLPAEKAFDVVLFTCKAYDLDDAIETIAPAVTDATVVLPVLNGMSHMERLNARFGEPRVWGGVAKIAAQMLPDGTIKHLNDWRGLVLGEQSGVMTERAKAFAAAFGTTAVQAEAVTDITRAMWEKCVHLTTAATMTSLMRAHVAEIVRGGGGELMREAIDVNCEIAAREGFPLREDVRAGFTRMMTDPNVQYGSSSMLRDIESKGRVESDHIVGFMRDKAKKHGIPARLLDISYVGLKAYEQRQAAGRL
ncbi:MAG: 2-dehydropantoate 2-reductase [Rhodospirillaceae bacterium]